MKISLVAALIFSVLNIAQAAELCSKDSEGNWKTTKGAACYMGQQQPGQPPAKRSDQPVQLAVVSSTATATAETTKSQGAILRRFTFLASDKTVDGAFSRWAEESKLGKKVTWRVARKPPLDALGDFEAENAVVAMTMVAASFENSRNPFVVEEYDNVIVVVPRIAARLQAK